jgi:hypothetical protein
MYQLSWLTSHMRWKKMAHTALNEHRNTRPLLLLAMATMAAMCAVRQGRTLLHFSA